MEEIAGRRRPEAPTRGKAFTPINTHLLSGGYCCNPHKAPLNDMQIIVETNGPPEIYAAEKLQTRVRPPDYCPRCARQTTLRAHCYYRRNTTDSEGHAVAIMIRRFKCRVCKATISCLPAFAQPYRYVNCATIQRSFAGEVDRLDVARNASLLRRYWNQFARWCGSLYRAVSPETGAIPHPADIWKTIVCDEVTLAAVTACLVRHFHITCFGQYRCHQINETAA